VPALDYQRARNLLDVAFAEAEKDLLGDNPPAVERAVVQACDVLFATSVQAYREALLGCLVAKMMDPSINIRLPYVGQGSDAFNGRTLDEKAVNPFSSLSKTSKQPMSWPKHASISPRATK
jgi:hypothetical protein